MQVGRVALIIVDQWLRRSPAAVAPPMRSRRRIPGGPGCRIENGHGCDKSPWSLWALRTKGIIHGRNDRWLTISTLAVQTRRLLMRMIIDKQNVEQELRTPWRSKNYNPQSTGFENAKCFEIWSCECMWYVWQSQIRTYKCLWPRAMAGFWPAAWKVRKLPSFQTDPPRILQNVRRYLGKAIHLLYLFKKSHEAWETNFTTSQDWKTIRNICICKYIDILSLSPSLPLSLPPSLALSLSLSLPPSPSLTHYTHTIYIN